MSTLKSDPCTDIILDFIAGGVPENLGGESGGNYNAVIGNARAAADLGLLTFQGIYALMDKLLADGEPSTAVGRYQIIRRTMQALQAGLKLPDDTLFTPAVQDQLAARLLSGRGYAPWRSGQTTDFEFAHAISCEWASLPDPERYGSSHYDGVGANHAGTTLDRVYRMLGRAREAKGVGP